MLTSTENGLAKKTRELCQALLEEPQFQQIRKQIDAFFEDESAKSQFQAFTEKGEHLQHKQEQGVSLTEDEIAGFERERAALFENPVTRGFIEAQDAMQQVQQSVGRQLAKTFELGRLPEESDFHSCGGGGCGCSH